MNPQNDSFLTSQTKAARGCEKSAKLCPQENYDQLSNTTTTTTTTTATTTTTTTTTTTSTNDDDDDDYDDNDNNNDKSY